MGGQFSNCHGNNGNYGKRLPPQLGNLTPNLTPNLPKLPGNEANCHNCHGNWRTATFGVNWGIAPPIMAIFRSRTCAGKKLRGEQAEKIEGPLELPELGGQFPDCLYCHGNYGNCEIAPQFGQLTPPIWPISASTFAIIAPPIT